ncbi:MAG: AAA family ATPase [Prevotella sp.]|nr:AAA family ATPase [Prevotella sp.]
MSEKLNQQIRHLLFLNPLLDIRVIKNHLAMLPNQLNNDKLETIRLLTRQRMDFVNSSSNNGYIKRHIRNWEKEIGPVSFGDVVQLIEGRGITVMEAAPHLVVPQQIEQWLSGYLIGQPEYARKLSFCFYLHEIRKNDEQLNLPRPSLLVHGPSGVGKTYGPHKLAEIFQVPFGVVNCNSLVQEGIMGNTLTTVFTQLYMKYKEDMSSAVIIFDEFDKLFENGCYNERILNELLNIIDDSNTLTFNQTDAIYHNEKTSMKTNKMLFIFTGVFRGIEDIVRKRLGDHGIGFANGSGFNLEGDYHQYVNDDDFAKYFHRDELTGRILQYVYARELKEDDLVNILLHSVDSPVTTFVNYFKMRDVDISVTEDGARAIAAASIRRHLGVRGLKSLLFNILSDDMYAPNSQQIIVDKYFVELKTA